MNLGIGIKRTGEVHTPILQSQHKRCWRVPKNPLFSLKSFIFDPQLIELTPVLKA
jgi:hypothetical protein